MVGRSIISRTWYPAASEFLLVVKPFYLTASTDDWSGSRFPYTIGGILL